MEKRSSAAARAAAVIALICGFLVVVVVVVAALNDGGSDQRSGREGGSQVGRSNGDGGPTERKQPAVYVVEDGDTLTSIASRTGVSVARIEALNPEVDPQVLVSGEELKLR